MDGDWRPVYARANLIIASLASEPELPHTISTGPLIGANSPVLPALGFLASLLVFMGLDYQAKLYAGIWFSRTSTGKQIDIIISFYISNHCPPSMI